MAVIRNEATVGQSIIMGMNFTTNLGVPFDPFEISMVEIRDSNDIVLETITTANIHKSATGKYYIETGVSWNLVPRIVRDVWYYKPLSSSPVYQAIATTNIFEFDATPDDSVYLSVEELKKTKTGIDFTKYSDEELYFYLQLAKEMIDNYTGQSFSAGTFTEKSEAIIDKFNKIVIRAKQKPVDEVVSLKIWYPAGVEDAYVINVQDDIEVFKEQGYIYLPITLFSENYFLRIVDKVVYELTYTTQGSIPKIVQYACTLLIANMLKSDYYSKIMNVPGVNGALKSFKSGDYSVAFDNQRIQAGDDPDSFLSSPIKEMLKKYKRMHQNTFF